MFKSYSIKQKQKRNNNYDREAHIAHKKRKFIKPSLDD
jgi:hypothetical protein